MKTFISGILDSESVSDTLYYIYSEPEGLRRIIGNIELTDEEVLALANETGTFDFLNNEDEDIYGINDGKKTKDESEI